MNSDLARALAIGLKQPLLSVKLLWPDVTIYDKQREILMSVENTPETVVVAGNQLGKDWIAGLIVVRAFLVHQEARIITTSVKDDHLRVLWGEMGRFISTCRFPLRAQEGGPLLITHRDIRKVNQQTGTLHDISYCRGMVSEHGEGLAGHHAAYTLGVIDEASGCSPVVWDMFGGWAKHLLVFGNPNECPLTHPFRAAVAKGDIMA